MEAPRPSLRTASALEYESIDLDDRTSMRAQISFLFWLLLLFSHTAAGYALAHFSRSQPPASLPGAVPWFGIMAVGCLVLLGIWITVGTRDRYRGWDGFIWLLIAPTCGVGLVFDTVLCLLIYFGAD